MDRSQLVPMSPQELVQRLNQVDAKSSRLQESINLSNDTNARHFKAIVKELSSQTRARSDHEGKLEDALSAFEKALVEQKDWAIEQTQLLAALVGQLMSVTATSTATLAPAPQVEEGVQSNPPKFECRFHAHSNNSLPQWRLRW
jgi:hypothetical protein